MLSFGHPVLTLLAFVVVIVYADHHLTLKVLLALAWLLHSVLIEVDRHVGRLTCSCMCLSLLEIRLVFLLGRRKNIGLR